MREGLQKAEEATSNKQKLQTMKPTLIYGTLSQ